MTLAMKLTWVIMHTLIIIILIIIKNEISMNTIRRDFNVMFNLWRNRRKLAEFKHIFLIKKVIFKISRVTL